MNPNGRPKGSKNKKHKQFCPKGHDTFAVGRYKSGRCNQCIEDRNQLAREETQKNKSPFCPKGHNKDIVGREKKGDCKLCKKLRGRKDPNKDLRVHQFCPKGHNTFITGRNKGGSCTLCIREKSRESNKLNVEYRRRYNEEHKEERRKKDRERNAFPEVKERKRTYNKKYHAEHRERIREKRKEWKTEHRELVRLSNLRHDAKRGLRVPKWADIKEINKIVKQCPVNKVVDHIIPLCGKLISGLHVSWNLQYLTWSENSSKRHSVNLLEASKWCGEILKQAGLK